jgi:hypothetical protein
VADVDESITIRADPHAVYDLVSDLPRMGEWSPENTGGRWLGGATGPAKGARFRGTNRRTWRRWSTTATVTDATPGERFGFTVSYGPVAISHWAYALQAQDGGCAVTESWTDLRPAWIRIAGDALLRISSRAEHNRAGMRVTLERLKAAAEG